MIDLSKLGGDTGSAGVMPTPGASSAPLDSLPDFAPPPAAADPNAGEAPWDTLGRVIWGTAEEGGTLGQIPVVGDVARIPGQLTRGLFEAGGVGLHAIADAGANVLGRAPIGTLTAMPNVTDPYNLGQALGSGVNPFDQKYTADPVGAVALLDDLKTENGTGNLSRQFMVLGQWQQQHDPEAFKAWQEALARAQESTGVGSHAGNILNDYIRQWAVTYNDMTPEGVEGWLSVAPELAYGGSASAGQGLMDALSAIMTAQRHAEVGAATMSGNVSGLGGALEGHRYAPGYDDFGSRVNELLHLSDNDPSKLSDVEAAAVYGMKELGWTAQHTYSYLVSHGQGYSKDGVTQVALSLALDPTFVGGLGAGQAANVGTRASLGYAKTAESAGRLTGMYRGMAKSIGTTVAEVRGGPMGPAFKAARAVIDPFSVFPKTPHGSAQVDVFAAAGIEGTRRGLGVGPVADFFARSKAWGVGEIADRAFGQAAMNFARKWVGTEHIGNLSKFTEPGARRVLEEETLQAAGRAAPKDAATRLADYVMGKREFWLSSAGVDQLTERMVKMTGRSQEEVAEAVATMSRDEQAVWHVATYSEAWRDFVTAARAVPAEEWGALAPKLDDLVILNPAELDNVAARELLHVVQGLKGKAAIAMWNQAANRYSLIESLGRVTTGGPAQLERRLATLDRIISEGGLHSALDIREMKALPSGFQRKFMGKWTGIDGEPIWRLGFKPKAMQATGLVYDDAGRLVQRYDPVIENVTDAIPMATGSLRAVTDPLGRLIPGAVKGSRAGRAARAGYDSLDVALRTATDMVSGQRIMTSMEQQFLRQMHEARPDIPARVAKQVFKQSRVAAQEGGFTIAGMSPDEFWRVNKEALTDLVDARVAKRDIFTMLAKSAGGDMRLLGLGSGTTQRIRSGLIARGLDPNNYMGAVTIKLYNLARYALNPMFFLQAEFDAPWFNMYRGVMFDLRGKAPKPGTALWEMQGITEAMGHTSLSRDLAMDYTERVATIGFQQEVVDALRQVNFEQSFGARIKQRLGRMILNNEMLYINSQAGDIVYSAIASTKKALQERAALAATPEEAALWRNQGLDIERVFESLTDELTETLGRKPTTNELGRRYLTEMIEDSHLEVRTKDGLLDYQRVAQKGAYYVPTDLGELRPLNLDYGAESLGLPNIHSADQLRDALKRGVYTKSDIKDILTNLGYHKDHSKRFMDAITFNWRHYFDDLRSELQMTRFEMQGIEDLVAREAKALKMDPVDYITQVLPLGAARKGGSKDIAGMSEHMKAVLGIMRASKKGGEAGVEEMARVVASNLQPSMKQALLDHFMERITGRNGLIEKAMKAGDQQAAQDLNRILEDLKGGWGDAADAEFRDLVIRRASGENVGAAGIPEPEVERAARYFSKYVQEMGPQLGAGEVLKGIVDAIPVEGASPYHFTQGVLMQNLAENFRLAEKDAIRLAHMQTERSVLERSMNHPFFAMYPSSYFWGKVIPETFKFVAYEPFGMRTTLGAEAYFKVKQSIELQSMYDDRLQDLWTKVGKSAVMGLISYASPSMPWEDMKSSLPPWVRSLSRGESFEQLLAREFDTFSPERWVNHFREAGEEVVGGLQGAVEDATTPPEQQGLQAIINTPGGPVDGSLLAEGSTFKGTVTGMDLGPVLAGEFAALQTALTGE